MKAEIGLVVIKSVWTLSEYFYSSTVLKCNFGVLHPTTLFLHYTTLITQILSFLIHKICFVLL